MKVCLGEKIEGRCHGLEQRMIEGEQCTDERLISLEMPRTEAEVSHSVLKKQFDDMCLEVHCVNRFMERETMQHACGGHDIIGGSDPVSAVHHQEADVTGNRYVSADFSCSCD
jgi:hypothetical protein